MTVLNQLLANWEQVLSILTTIGAGIGWLRERGKRMRDNRDRDVSYWEKALKLQDALIDKQNERILTLELKYEKKIQDMELKYELRIEELQQEIKELSDRLEKYEPVNKRIKK